MLSPPVDPRVLAHYLAAIAAAKLSTATISSGFRSAQDARDLMSRVSALSIPDAAAMLRARFGAS